MLRTITTKYVLSADEVIEFLMDRLEGNKPPGCTIDFLDIDSNSFTLDRVEITIEEAFSEEG